jgi:hypothetical protein
MNTLWKLWAKSLGAKASSCDRESDRVAIIRTIIFASYFITNSFIIANAIRHWNSNDVPVFQVAPSCEMLLNSRYNKIEPNTVIPHESHQSKNILQ